jgi:hypothetical protein
MSLGSCADTTSATELHPDGPPRITQVYMWESYPSAPGSLTYNKQQVFGFGTHPKADASIIHEVTSAVVKSQTLRIIMSELLVGNNLEEIQCRGVVGADGAWGRVPLGATPTDIAACAVSTDILPQTCVGPHAVCVGPDPAHPVGVQDANEDGAADDSRFIQGAVAMKCGTIDVPVDLDNSYWNPSGDQQVPAIGGFNALGPAIVLTPLGVMPTNQDCHLEFDPTIVDKQGNKVCTSTNGDVNVLCTPGDTSLFKFHTEPLRTGDPFFDGSNVNHVLTDDILIVFNAPVDAASIATITMTAGGAAFSGFTATLNADKTQLTIHPTSGSWTAATSYVITLPVTVKDTWGIPLPAALTFAFATA